MYRKIHRFFFNISGLFLKFSFSRICTSMTGSCVNNVEFLTSNGMPLKLRRRDQLLSHSKHKDHVGQNKLRKLWDSSNSEQSLVQINLQLITTLLGKGQCKVLFSFVFRVTIHQAQLLHTVTFNHLWVWICRVIPTKPLMHEV